ncbi:MAG: hypothetical protein IT220_09260 [Flavobacteriaceae bacterium]|nr:hypothetical protein [Flavobacteriaceae bacterium]
MEILIPSDQNWKKSVIFGLISLTFLGMTVIARPTMSGYAPHMYVFNIGFFLPMMFLSFGFGIAGWISYLRIDKLKRKEYGFIYKLIPILLIAPIGIRFLLMIINIVIILFTE